jgi:hypothetical protein
MAAACKAIFKLVCVFTCHSKAVYEHEWPRAKPPAGGPFQIIIKKRIYGLVTKILKAPAASAGPADSRTRLRGFGNKPGRQLPREQYHLGMPPPSWRFSSKPLAIFNLFALWKQILLVKEDRLPGNIYLTPGKLLNTASFFVYFVGVRFSCGG